MAWRHMEGKEVGVENKAGTQNAEERTVGIEGEREKLERLWKSNVKIIYILILEVYGREMRTSLM